MPRALCEGLPVFDPDVTLLYLEVAQGFWGSAALLAHIPQQGEERALLGAFSSHPLPHSSAGAGWEPILTLVLPVPPNASIMLPAPFLLVLCSGFVPGGCRKSAQQGRALNPQLPLSSAVPGLLVADCGGSVGVVGRLCQSSPPEDSWYDCSHAGMLLGWQSRQGTASAPLRGAGMDRCR